SRHRSPWGGRAAIAGVIVAVAGVVWLLVVPLLHRVRRARRRAAAATPTARTLVAWEEATEALTVLGVGPLPAETPAEYAARASDVAHLPAGLLPGLARDSSAAAYSSRGVD